MLGVNNWQGVFIWREAIKLMSIREGYVKMYTKQPKQAKQVEGYSQPNTEVDFPHTLVTRQEIRDKLEDMLEVNEIREMLQLCYLAYYEKVVFSGDTRWPDSYVNRFRSLRGL